MAGPAFTLARPSLYIVSTMMRFATKTTTTTKTTTFGGPARTCA